MYHIGAVRVALEVVNCKAGSVQLIISTPGSSVGNAFRCMLSREATYIGESIDNTAGWRLGENHIDADSCDGEMNDKR
jgi:hypothetical protein